MFQKKLIFPFILTIFTLLFLLAEEPPPPQQVANTVSNFWINQDFNGLETYITNLYTSHPNYIPAILASSFHDMIYLGNFVSTSNKLAYVQIAITNTPSAYTEEFKGLVGELQFRTAREINLHIQTGITPEVLQSNASPSTIRGLWGTELPPRINILFHVPATNAP